MQKPFCKCTNKSHSRTKTFFPIQNNTRKIPQLCPALAAVHTPQRQHIHFSPKSPISNSHSHTHRPNNGRMNKERHKTRRVQHKKKEFLVYKGAGGTGADEWGGRKILLCFMKDEFCKEFSGFVWAVKIRAFHHLLLALAVSSSHFCCFFSAKIPW